MRNNYFFLIISSVLFLNTLQYFSNPVAAQLPRNMGVIDFLNIPGVSDPELSPSGSQLLYVLSESDWKANKQISHVWRCYADGSNTRQLTYGEKGESSPTWSPDGQWIAFLTARGKDENTQIYLMPNDGGEARALTHHKTSVSSAQWSPDGKSIYFLASEEESAEEKKRKEWKDDVNTYDESYQQRHLWKVSIPGGLESRITSGDSSVTAYSLTRDGAKIVFHRSPSPLFGDAFLSEIWIMDADGKNQKQITHNGVSESNARLSPDGSQLLFLAGANEKFETYYNSKLFLTPADGSKAAYLPIKNAHYNISQAEWSSDGKLIFFIADMGLESHLVKFDVATGQTLEMTAGEHSLGSWHYAYRSGKHVFNVANEHSPGDVFLLDANRLSKITNHYDYLQDTFHIPTQERISWKGADGITIEGLLSYPIGYKEGQRYPLVVQTHGGPASADQFGLSRGITHYTPVLTAMGYAVFQPNYRGSTGYGDSFMRDMVGGYFRQSHLDVMTGIDHLIAKGIADPDKLIKMGWSAGGHMTNKLITYTNRFKAASSGAGAANWISMYAQSDVRTYRTPWFGGTPWQADAPIDVYWNHSPIKEVHKVKTPTLFLVGGNDPRVPLPQSVEMFRALKSLGVPTHLYVAPREPHGWGELRHRLYKINVELEWFEKYALGKKYDWEKVKEQ